MGAAAARRVLPWRPALLSWGRAPSCTLRRLCAHGLLCLLCLSAFAPAGRILQGLRASLLSLLLLSLLQGLGLYEEGRLPAQLSAAAAAGAPPPRVRPLRHGLGALTNLSALNLSDNAFAELPGWLAKLRRLQVLDLSGCAYLKVLLHRVQRSAARPGVRAGCKRKQRLLEPLTDCDFTTPGTACCFAAAGAGHCQPAWATR